MNIQVEFPERTIAQVITLLRSFCRTKGKVPYLVALVEGTDAERDAWRKVAIDYLTAKAKGVKSDLLGKDEPTGESNDEAYSEIN